VLPANASAIGAAPCDQFGVCHGVRPFAGMTRIRFKGWRRGIQRHLSRLPPAPLEELSVGQSIGVSTDPGAATAWELRAKGSE
jgi:hypothetical protein